ncbi:alpha/beta hydrolase [Antrihabitans stalactiti]|uniref:Esterase family protein n=1 Tax=Antrihabitans stalactiti TaxID=2584121 RepID=A0A848KNA6_9NOCA|nr:alpha/beta hydrolase family protein [Antrihabitans stalactiti]NMN99428.1 esterase family protein [Antrihabitans stalactiti]
MNVRPAVADELGVPGELQAYVQSPNGSYVEKVRAVDDQHLYVFVHSASMDKTVPVQVQRPDDTSAPRPVLYLLNGAGGGEDLASWTLKTDALQFLADKKVNVVTPIGGSWSYYADWKHPDPVLGVNKWKTFLTEELPPIIDAGLGTNGKNSIAGISTSGTTVLALSEAAPGLYQSAASYSGCAEISDPVHQQLVKVTVETWGHGNTLNMYGPLDDPAWAANDPYVHADKLRGVALYISNGNGIPGRYDYPGEPRALPGLDGIAQQIAIGGVIEAATNICAHKLAEKLGGLGIPAQFKFRDSGTHSWGYWQDDLKDSWPVISAPLGI